MPVQPSKTPVQPAKQPVRCNPATREAGPVVRLAEFDRLRALSLSVTVDVYGVVMDALETAQAHYLQSAREIDAMRVGTAAGELCRMRAERIADLLEGCADRETLAARLAQD